jgi:transposase, IS30 family
MTNYANGLRIARVTWDFVHDKLAQTWSPQQISGYLNVNYCPGIRHETIYRHIYADKLASGALHRCLRCQKVRKKRYGGRERRGTIPHQLSIDARPSIVGKRAHLGD